MSAEGFWKWVARINSLWALAIKISVACAVLGGGSVAFATWFNGWPFVLAVIITLAGGLLSGGVTLAVFSGIGFLLRRRAGEEKTQLARRTEQSSAGSMELSVFIAFCRYRDEAIQCIDAYLNERQELENDSEIDAKFRELAVSETLPEGTAKPTGYLRCGKPIPWNGVCCGWPESARQAADFLRTVGEIGEASGIYRELSSLPTEVTDWDWERLHDYHDVTREAALQVKAILTAIRPAAPAN